MDDPTTPVDDQGDDQDEDKSSPAETAGEGVMEEAAPVAGGDQAEEEGEKTPAGKQEESAMPAESKEDAVE